LRNLDKAHLCAIVQWGAEISIDDVGIGLVPEQQLHNLAMSPQHGQMQRSAPHGLGLGVDITAVGNERLCHIEALGGGVMQETPPMQVYVVVEVD
jgi:hypothetical protein